MPQEKRVRLMRLTKSKQIIFGFCAQNKWSLLEFAELYDEKRWNDHEKKDRQAVGDCGKLNRRGGVYRGLSAK